ncbi:MAG: hypothetical protein OEV92_12640 [Nitrospinota bacterium]|nr:hypothetical protein [Nitrospinota bacterium]
MDWKELDGLINELERMIDSKLNRGIYLVTVLVPSSVTWGHIWAKAAEIQDGFKGVRYPTKDQREEAWGRFNSLRNDASRRNQEEHDRRRSLSETHLSAILHQVSNARPAKFIIAHPDVNEMKDLSHILHEAGQMLSERKGEMLPEHKQESFAAIQEMKKGHDAWWESLKDAQHQRRQERESKIRENLAKNYERHRKATDALSRYQSAAEDLRSQIATAYSEDWASKAEGRLSKLEDKIADIERSIEQFEEWIREDEGKLS